MENSKVDEHYIQTLFNRFEKLDFGESHQVDLQKIGADGERFKVSEEFNRKFKNRRVLFRPHNVLIDRIGGSNEVWYIYKEKGEPGITWTSGSF